jgi:polyvinyl alcohol dehydrogenase (cytochrome)
MITTCPRGLTLVLLAIGGQSWLACTTRAQAQANVPAQARSVPSLGTESGFGIFQQRCMGCHGNREMSEKAPDPSVLRQMTPEAIYESLTSGVMRVEGEQLSEEERRRVAESVSGRLLGTATNGDAGVMPNRCPGNPPMRDPSTAPAWNGWGADVANTRFQPGKTAGLPVERVPDLTLKWAFGFPNGVSAYGQPTVASGRVFVGADTGYVYALDATSGCVYWSFKTKAGVRNAISIGSVRGVGSTTLAAYFGDVKGNVYGLDAWNGTLLWTSHPDDHVTARITGAPTLHDGRLYVPVSSWEEFSARTLDYPCCTFRGSVSALDARTGRQIWKTYVIPEEPAPIRKNSKGVQLWAPAGAAVWNSPTVDVRRRAIYFGTGDSETAPAAKTSDAVMALDMETGKVQWVFQAYENDSYLVGCVGASRTDNCPVVQGPDLDIPGSPILRALPNGRRVLIVATKTGDVFGLDPDRNGSLLWKVNVSDRPRSGIFWGGATDEQHGYFGLSGGGVAAIALTTGARKWFVPLAAEGTRVSHAAAATAIPGVVFVSGSDGTLHALASADGRQLWKYDTAREFATTNKVAAKGGSIRAPGPTVAGGMLFIASGYGVFGSDLPGNVLLAFSTER